MDVSYSSDEENLNVGSSDDLDSEVENFTGYGNEPEYTRSRKFLNKLILLVVVCTIIFVLSYVSVSTAGGERHLNFILTDL